MRNIGIKMSKTQFYRFTENNDNEGETWDFYFPMTEEEAKHFYGVFIQAETEVNDFPYSFEHDDILSEKEIDVLVKHSRSGYMAYHNKCLKTIKPILELTVDDFLEDDIFYKGGFFVKK